MPIYDYKCLNKKCGKEFDAYYASFSVVPEQEPEEKCPHCGSKKKQKLVSKGASFILKGSGWAKDRYGK